MRNSNLKPQDILLAVHLLEDVRFRRQSDYAKELGVSQGEISAALGRLVNAHLLDPELQLPYRENLKELIIHGLRYIFPVKPGGITKGIPTAHSAGPLSRRLRSSGPGFVWPSEKGEANGQALEPLYHSVPEAVQSNPALAERLALIDAIRIGKPRERAIAIEEFGKRL